MTAVILPAGAPTGKHIKWKSINWKKVSMFVKRLQMRIAKSLLQKHMKAHRMRYILYIGVSHDTLCSADLSIGVVSARGSQRLLKRCQCKQYTY